MATTNVFSSASSFSLQHTALATRKDASPFASGAGSMLPTLQHHGVALTPFQAAQQQLVAAQMAHHMATSSSPLRGTSFSVQQQQRMAASGAGVGSPAKPPQHAANPISMSPLHMAALGASGSQPLSRASSPGIKSRNVSMNLDGNSSHSTSTTANEEGQAVFPPPAPPAAPPPRAAPRTSVRNLNATFNRASCPGVGSAMGVAALPDQLSHTARRTSLMGLPQAAQPQPLQQPQFGASPSFSHMSGYAQQHLQAAPAAMGPTHDMHQQSMFTFGPAAIAGYSSSSQAQSGAAAAMGASMRRGPILSLKDTPGGQPQGQTASLPHGLTATPRRSMGMEGLGSGAAPMSTSGTPSTSLGLRPSTSGMAGGGTPAASSPFKATPVPPSLPMPALRPSTSGMSTPIAGSPVKTSGMAVTRTVATNSSPLPSRLSYAEATGGGGTRAMASTLPRVKLTAGGDPYEEQEEELPVPDGTVRHWRHPKQGAASREPQVSSLPQATQPHAPPHAPPRRPRDPDEDEFDEDDSRSQDNEMEASDDEDEYEEEAPPDPPSERTLRWLEETTMLILAKAKVPGVALPRDSLF